MSGIAERASATPLDRRGRTRTPCTARGRSRRSPGRSGEPCPHPSSSIHPLSLHVRHPRRRTRSTRPRRCAPGLDEREEVGREPDPRVRAEHRAGERLQRPLQVGERDPLVDREALDLVEHGHVRRVGRRPAGTRGPGAITYTGGCWRSMVRICIARGLRAQQQVGCAGHVEVDRVLLAAGGWSARDVEGVEVVLLGLDLGALDHAVAHAGEHVDDPVLDDRQRMERAGPGRPPGQGDVDAVGLQARSRALRREQLARRASSAASSSSRTSFVRRPTRGVVLAERAERPLDLTERRLPARARSPAACPVRPASLQRRTAPAAFELVVERAEGVGGVHGSRSVATTARGSESGAAALGAHGVQERSDPVSSVSGAPGAARIRRTRRR